MEQNQFTNEAIWQYCLEHTHSASEIIETLKNETIEGVHGAQMLSEKIVTKLLQFFAFTLNAKICVDVGTYTGMSAVAMAESTGNDSFVYTIDRHNQAGEEIAKKYFKSYPKIKYLVGDAIELLPNLPSSIDLVFIDADKKQTKSYFEILLPKLSDKGVIVVDDILWRGEVIAPEDKRAKALDDFNKYIKSRDDVDNMVLPIRHGLNIIRKIQG